MSAVTFFNPEVTAEPLFSSLKRAALLGAPDEPPLGLDSVKLPGGGGGGAAGGPPLPPVAPALDPEKFFTSWPPAFQLGPVGWCSFT